MRALATAAIVGAIALADRSSISARQSQSKTATLQVRADVPAECRVVVEPLDFGNYDPVEVNATAPATTNGSIRLTCTRGTIATVALGFGQNGSGTTRQMTGPSALRLTYGLYKDAGFSQVWGTSSAQALVLPAAPSLAERTFTVYGRLPGGQGVLAGAYNDLVVVNVSF